MNPEVVSLVAARHPNWKRPDLTVYETWGGTHMGLDIRLPIGLMFTLFGLLLVVYGVLSDKAIYQRSLGLNVNLGWGVVLLIFGVVMLVLGRRGTATAEPADASQEGRRMMTEIAERDAESKQ
jgi:hypothetical protein